MPRKPADLTGQRFGNLTVQGMSGERNNQGRVLYRCLCDCGGTVEATYSNLKRGEVTSCGCKNHLPRKDLTGQQFGRLTVIKIAEPPQGRRCTTYKWRCRCDCGKETIVTTNDLTTGKTQSCGCMQRDAVKGLYQDGTAACKLKESSKPRKTNTSGVTGVWWDARRNMWVAEIMFQGKKHNLGRYCKKEDAVSARKEAENRIFGKYLSAIKDGQ